MFMYSRLIAALVFFVASFTMATDFTNATKKVSPSFDFTQYHITVPFKVNLPVIALDLLDDGQLSVDELIVIGKDELNVTWLAAYGFNDKISEYELLDKIRFADEYFAFDVSEDNGGLYFLSKNKVAILQYQNKLNIDDRSKPALTLKHVQDVNSIFLLNEAGYLEEQNFIQDLNQDGKDDIVLPDFEHVNLWLSSPNNSAHFYQRLAINPQIMLERGGVKYTPTSLFIADYTLDQRQDIAWVSQGILHYFSQNEAGFFSAQANQIALADGIYGIHWWNIREADGENLDQSHLIHRATEDIQDINGDGLADIIVRFTQSSGVLDRANDYEFYFGYLDKQKNLAWPKTANTVIKAEGTLTGLKVVDVNADKKLEVLLSSFELSVSNIIGALLSGDIDQNVLIFALNDHNRYEKEALISKEVALSFSLTSGKSGQPIVLLSDVDGDGLQDLVLSSETDQLAIYLGNKSSRLFNRKASMHRVLLPKNGELLTPQDVNHDGKIDFIIRYGRLDDQRLANKITLLVAN